MSESTPSEPLRDLPLLKALMDAVSLFEGLHIPYALIGGIAAMVYGRARFTEDVDFAVAENAEHQLAANPDLLKQHHFDSAITWKLYHNSGIELDLWKDAFTDAITQNAHETALAGRLVRIADVHDLIAMKLRAGRPQDIYDISEILKATSVDSAILRSRITPEQFARFQALVLKLSY